MGVVVGDMSPGASPAIAGPWAAQRMGQCCRLSPGLQCLLLCFTSLSFNLFSAVVGGL